MYQQRPWPARPPATYHPPAAPVPYPPVTYRPVPQTTVVQVQIQQVGPSRTVIRKAWWWHAGHLTMVSLTLGLWLPVYLGALSRYKSTFVTTRRR